MKSFARFALTAALTAGAALASAPAAQPPGGAKAPATKTPEEKAKAAFEAVQMMNEAFHLMDLAEKNKQPELYVAAYRLFVIMDKDKLDTLFTPLEAKPEVRGEDGKPVAGAKPAIKPNESFKTLADKCKEEAEGWAEKEGRLKTVTDLLTSIEKNPYPVGTRNAIGGPKLITQVIPAGQTHVHTIDFDTVTPGAIGFQAAAPIRCTMEYKTFVHFNQVVRVGSYSWQPAKDAGKVKTYKITVHNHTANPVEYKLFTN